MKFDKFDKEQVQSAINLGMYKTPYPGVTKEFVLDALAWFASAEGQQYVDEALNWWQNKGNTQPEKREINLTFVQTIQWNEECGFWFDSVTLRVVHSYGEFIKGGGEVFMKKTHGKTGSFRADLSQIPADAEIHEAYLVMKLNRGEGIANADRTGVFEIRNGKDIAVAEVRADWINQNYQKYSKPNVKIDITPYVRGFFDG
jgi:hypothetical protein